MFTLCTNNIRASASIFGDRSFWKWVEGLNGHVVFCFFVFLETALMSLLALPMLMPNSCRSDLLHSLTSPAECKQASLSFVMVSLSPQLLAKAKLRRSVSMLSCHCNSHTAVKARSLPPPMFSCAAAVGSSAYGARIIQPGVTWAGFDPNGVTFTWPYRFGNHLHVRCHDCLNRPASCRVLPLFLLFQLISNAVVADETLRSCS
jgi:hypothetical protein